MKKLVFMLLMLAPLMANAQSDPATKARVADVRAAYKQALADINAVQKGEEGAQNDALVSMRLNRPDSGATSETLEFYAEVKQDTVGGYEYETFFIRRSYSMSARKYYNEFLFDRETGDLIFAYVRSSSEDEPNIKIEDRYYFDNGSLVPIWHTATGLDTEKNTLISQKQVEKHQWQGGDDFFQSVPASLRSAFHSLANCAH